MATREGVEAVVIVCSFGLFLGYHIWLFVFRGRGSKVNPKYHDYFQAGKLARSIWAEACATDEKDAILGVQQARNAMTACTYLATVSVALATAGITIIFDEGKMARIESLAIKDPMMRNLEGAPLVPPIAIIAAALGSLYAGFVCFAQSVRLYVHTGFYIRACTSHFNPGTLTVAEAKRVTIHAGLAFTVGLRFFYLFIPLVMWSIGVTALLVSAVVMTALVAYLDHFDMPTVEEQAATQELLERLSTQELQGGDGDTRLTMQRSAATTMSGIMSPFRECQDSSHPPPRLSNSSQKEVVLTRQQSRATHPSRASTAQKLDDAYLHSMV